MDKSVIDIPFTQEDKAKWVADKWYVWNTNRNAWLESKQELRNYLFATDTTGTTNKKLPWKNSTVSPKLTQIRDNLHANYMAALFPSENWFVWNSEDREAASVQKRDAITCYMKGKLKASGFELVVSQLVYDYIDYGNVFAGHQFVKETAKGEEGEEIITYVGPKAYRISPLDIVMNPMAATFNDTPVVVRKMKSIGDIVKEAASNPTLGYSPEVLNKIHEMRHFVMDNSDRIKSNGLMVDGFGSYEMYLKSGLVEVLEFWGDYYDVTSKTLKTNCHITVVDRMFVLHEETNPSWLGVKPFRHCGWRLRPDNLWAQGPLDQLVGMQYRIDHLENLKADVFDQIAHPIAIIYGNTCEEFQYQPGLNVHVGDEGKVEFARPEANALGADMQIANLMERMEEMAGAPKQAAGIRTPGEKTKYEVQVLENGAGRIFQSKVDWFERNILEPLLNSMLEESRRRMGESDSIKYTNEDGVEVFTTITKDDLTGKGKLYPIGARYYTEQAKFLQELTGTLNQIQNVQSVSVHISGFAVAKALEDVLGWKPYNIVKKNVGISEQAETQKFMNTAQENIAAHSTMPSELQSEDYISPEEAQDNEQLTSQTQASGPNTSQVAGALGGAGVYAGLPTGGN